MVEFSIQGTLSTLAPDAWYKDRMQSSFWLRIVTMVGQEPTRFVEQFRGLKKGAIDLGAPIQAAFGTTKDFKIPHFTSVTAAGDDGSTFVHLNVSEQTLPSAHYWFLATPLNVDGVPGSEADARRVLQRFSALVVAHCGFNTMRDVVFEGQVDAGTDKLHAYSPVVRMTQPADGPFMAPPMWEAMEEEATALRSTPIERRRRIELSLEFFERGVRGTEAFFNYWTALEILCNGSSQTIKTKVQKCYSLKSVGDVDSQTGMRMLARWRHDYFHKGKRPDFVGDEARYIQMLFLDLLRYELHLPSNGYVAAVQVAAGYNFSGLGLPDNRTPEQLAAVQRSLAQQG